MSKPLRISFHTLGCKLNQLESESFADAFKIKGSIILPGDGEFGADLIVINTCTVTSKAEQKARRIIRLALAANPEAVALVTGCYAQVEAEALGSLHERAIVLPGSLKDAVLRLPSWLAGREDGRDDLLGALREWLFDAFADSSSGEEGRFAYDPENFAFHSRPALKVQDGCDNECAYCRVRIARGRASSLASGEALARARALEKAGRSEIVLTGVNLSQYRDGEVDFPALLGLLLAGTRRIAIRLSSYEPDRINEAFLEAFAHPRVRPHLHLAVQSGADPVLERMGRRYGRLDVIAAIEALRRVKEDPFIAADFIAGFPGESEADACASLDLARACDFAWIHAFRFSPRPGTDAASMSGRVAEGLAGERVDALLDLGKAGRMAYSNRWLGKRTQAILESSLGATTANYLKVKPFGLPKSAIPGQAIHCSIEKRPDFADSSDYDAFAAYIDDELL